VCFNFIKTPLGRPDGATGTAAARCEPSAGEP
jgi:hypothetical protein